MVRNFIILSSFVLSACSIFERHPESGYSANVQKSQSGWKKLGNSASNSSLKPELRSLESSLSGRREIEQYSRALPWFNDDQERLEFLGLGGYEARQRWLMEQDFFNRPKEFLSQYQEVIDARDITMGMPEPFVKRAWGDPEFVDASGNPAFQNFRYRYQKFVPTGNGFKEERKTVFIEAGRVSGWETD